MEVPTGLSRPATTTFAGLIVRLQELDKFVAQLQTDRHSVRGRMVRAIKDRRPPGIGRREQLRVLAGYLVDHGHGETGRVELDYFCGTLLGEDRDSEILARAEDAVNTIRVAVLRYGLTYRTGRLNLKSVNRPHVR
jgi:hypothetical protein